VTSLVVRNSSTSSKRAHSSSKSSEPTGISYTIAHHVFTEDGNRKIMIASLRYLDTFAKIDERRFFAERKLILDWSETRSLGTEEG
jgi:hypothetical protein